MTQKRVKRPRIRMSAEGDDPTEAQVLNEWELKALEVRSEFTPENIDGRTPWLTRL